MRQATGVYNKMLVARPPKRKDHQNIDIEFKHILHLPIYLIIIVNSFNYMNNKIIKNRRPIPLDLNIMLGPHKFKLWATVDQP